ERGRNSTIAFPASRAPCSATIISAVGELRNRCRLRRDSRSVAKTRCSSSISASRSARSALRTRASASGAWASEEGIVTNAAATIPASPRARTGGRHLVLAIAFIQPRHPTVSHLAGGCLSPQRPAHVDTDDHRRNLAVDSDRCGCLNRFVACRDQPHERRQAPRWEQNKSKEKSGKSRRSHSPPAEEL